MSALGLEIEEVSEDAKPQEDVTPLYWNNLKKILKFNLEFKKSIQKKIIEIMNNKFMTDVNRIIISLIVTKY